MTTTPRPSPAPPSRFTRGYEADFVDDQEGVPAPRQVDQAVIPSHYEARPAADRSTRRAACRGGRRGTRSQERTPAARTAEEPGSAMASGLPRDEAQRLSRATRRGHRMVRC